MFVRNWWLTLSKVIRLTSVHTPDVAQLYTQAKTIQELCRQRDFIIEEVTEERARWEAERLGFDRVAEALIAGRSHGGDSTYREEVCLLPLVDNANDVDPQISGVGASSRYSRRRQQSPSSEGDFSLPELYSCTHLPHRSSPSTT